MASLNIVSVDMAAAASVLTPPAAGATSFKIKAENNIDLKFTFNRNLATDETATIRCHMYEPVFEIDYYLEDDINVPTPPEIANALAEIIPLIQAADATSITVADAAVVSATAANATTTDVDSTVAKIITANINKQLQAIFPKNGVTQAVTDVAGSDNSPIENAESPKPSLVDTIKIQQKTRIANNQTAKHSEGAKTLATEVTSELAKLASSSEAQKLLIAKDIAVKVETIITEADATATSAKGVADSGVVLAPETSRTIGPTITAIETAVIAAKDAVTKLKTAIVKAENAISGAANTYTQSVRFPEELAGAEIRMTYYIKQKPDDLINLDKNGTAVAPDPIGKTIIIKSSVAGAPKSHKIYFAKDESIKFGVDDVSQEYVGTYHRNETAFCHIHTRGLYGKELNVQLAFKTASAPNDTNIFTASKVRIKNNIGIHSFALYLNKTAIVNWGTGADARTKMRARIVTTYLKDSSYKDLDATTDASIILTTTPQLAQAGRDITPPLGSSAGCVVEFRPNTTYKGNFGFSWYRKGDMSAYGVTTSSIYSRTGQAIPVNVPCNDQPFDDIMGRHFDVARTAIPRTNGAVIQNGNNSSRFFDPDSVMAENHKLDFRKLLLSFLPANNEYLVPVMTLRRNEEAELRLFIGARERIWKLEFEFDNSLAITDGYLTITPPTINDIPAMPYGVTTHIVKIKCLKEFSKELLFRVKAYPVLDSGIFNPMSDLAGVVRLLPNDVSHQRKIKVAFFNMITDINTTVQNGLTVPATPAGSTTGTPPLNTQQNDVIKYLNQAYINIEFAPIIDIDLRAPTTPVPAGTILYSSLANLHGTQNVINYSKSNELKKLLSEHPSVSPYNDQYKFFFTQDRCRNFTQNYNLGGFSSGEKFTICFNASSITDSTPTHELLHALGLAHTFDGSTSRAKYIYKDGMTDNIMDYSHLLQPPAPAAGVPPPPPLNLKLQSLFHWQWKAINNNL